jgi:hypothetical protein
MPKVEVYYTPVGTIKFPKTVINDKESNFLYVPSDLKKEDKCTWKFQIVVDPKECKELIKTLDAQSKEIKGANFKPYKADKSKEDGSDEYVETGLIGINFTSGFPITFIDCSKPPQQVHDTNVGWGSKVRVQFTTKPVNNKGKVGLGRYVRIVQIVELSDIGMDTSGFGEIDGWAMERDAKMQEVKAPTTPDEIQWSE